MAGGEGKWEGFKVHPLSNQCSVPRAGAGSEVHPTVREGEAGKRQDGEWHDANCSNGRELFNAEAAEVFAEERRESLLRFSEVKILCQNHLNGNTSTDGHRWKRMWGGGRGNHTQSIADRHGFSAHAKDPRGVETYSPRTERRAAGRILESVPRSRVHCAVKMIRTRRMRSMRSGEGILIGHESRSC